MVTVQDQFKKFSKSNPIIATTYSFDMPTIKEMISPRRGIRERSIIITDGDCFTINDQNLTFFDQGLSYFVYPACNIKAAFHPKVAIGLDEGMLKLLVGSHNLTEYGAKYNLEITGFYEIPLLETHAEVIQEISTFIMGLASCIRSDLTIKKTMLELVDCIQDLSSVDMVLKSRDSFHFLHPFEESIFKQLVEHIHEIEHVTVCAPFLSEDTEFVRDIIYSFGSKATFLIDPKNFSVNDDAKKVYEKHNVQILNIPENRRLHAKLFVFHTQHGDWTLYGSPNFTRNAFRKSVKEGGNVEAAILLPPSEKWKWERLFQNTVSTTQIKWSELESVERNNQPLSSKQLPIERWGYETPNNEGVILAKGIPDGTIVFVRLFGMNKVQKVMVSDGLLRFRIPSNWNEDSRYEVLNEAMEVIVSGFLNRSGATMRELSEVDIDDESKLHLWFYLRRLRNFETQTFYPPRSTEVPDILLDPRIWRPGPIASNWRPISKEILMMTPKKIYNEALSTFEDSWDEYCNEDSKMPLSVKVRQLLVTIDIFIEGAFYAYLLSGGSNEYLVFLVRELSEFFDLPCAENPILPWNEDNWKKSFCSSQEKEATDEWKKYGNRLCLDVSLLFDFWLYLNSKSVGYQAFSRRSLDVPIVTNRYYQTFMALKALIGPKKADASFQRVWDSRISFLRTNKDILLPSNLKDLEECMKHSYELARANL